MNENKILGIGIDLVNIDRFRNLDIIKDKNFFEKIFTKKEIDYCLNKSMPCQHFAARFACKEAIIKAINSIDSGIILNYNDIEILNNKKGIPKAYVNKKIVSYNNILISLSHSNTGAAAFSVIY